MPATYNALPPATPSGSQTQLCVVDGIYDSVRLLLNDAQASLSGDRSSSCLYLTRALIMLRQSERLSRTSPGRLPAWQVKRLVEYIDSHLDGPIRTVQLAAVLKLSVSHFSHAFKSTFGTTPQAYVASRRIDSACELMLSTDSSLTDIAFSHGFCDQSHFIRTFRRQIGMTPQAWRRQSGVDFGKKQAARAPASQSHL